MRCPDCLPNEGCNARPWYLVPFLRWIEVFVFYVFILIFACCGVIFWAAYVNRERLEQPVTHITVPIKYYLQPEKEPDAADRTK